MPLPQVADALRSLAAAPRRRRGRSPTSARSSSRCSSRRPKFAPDATFVGGHPLAGTEDSGWAAADPPLFRDAPWALTLEDDTDLDGLAADRRAGVRPGREAGARDGRRAGRRGGPRHRAAARAGRGAGAHRPGRRPARALAGRRLLPVRLAGSPAPARSSSPPGATATCRWSTALDDVIARLGAARDELAADRSVSALAAAGHQARMDWEHRRFAAGRTAAPTATSLLRARRTPAAGSPRCCATRTAIRLLGMRPTDARTDARPARAPTQIEQAVLAPLVLGLRRDRRGRRRRAADVERAGVVAVRRPPASVLDVDTVGCRSTCRHPHRLSCR